MIFVLIIASTVMAAALWGFAWAVAMFWFGMFVLAFATGVKNKHDEHLRRSSVSR